MKFMKKYIALVAAVLCAVLIAGCSDLFNELYVINQDETITPTDSTEEEKFSEKTESLSIDGTELTNVKGVESADEEIVIASVNEDGTVSLTSKGEGTTTVTVTGTGTNGNGRPILTTVTYDVTVAKDGKITCTKNGSETVRYETITPQDNSPDLVQTTSAKSKDENVATAVLNDDGTVTVVAAGEGVTKVTVKGTDENGIPVTLVYDVTVSDGDISIGKNPTVFIHKTQEINPKEAGNLDSVTETTSESEEIITVTENDTGTYTVTAQGEGETSITVIGKQGDYIIAVIYNVKVDSDGTLTVATPAVKKVYKVVIASGIEGGTVTASHVSATQGTTITLTATPDEDYSFGTFTVKDASNSDVTVTDDTFTMPESDVTVSATFKWPWYGTKKPSLAKEVGDIVFSDGSSTPYTDGLELSDEQKEHAVAVIFYVGTELNSDTFTVEKPKSTYELTVSKSDTTTVRTLGVGFAQATNLSWCITDASAYQKIINTIACDYATGNIGKGNWTFKGDKNGRDNLEQMGTYLPSISKTDDTGTAENYPAFYFAKKYASQTGSHVSGTDYEDDWYLPSVAELFQVWKNRTTVNAAIELCDGTQFDLTQKYFSSSQYMSPVTNALCIKFTNGDWSYDPKTYTTLYVCAIREF